jgi:hypothetical protein
MVCECNSNIVSVGSRVDASTEGAHPHVGMAAGVWVGIGAAVIVGISAGVGVGIGAGVGVGISAAVSAGIGAGVLWVGISACILVPFFISRWYE